MRVFACSSDTTSSAALCLSCMAVSGLVRSRTARSFAWRTTCPRAARSERSAATPVS